MKVALKGIPDRAFPQPDDVVSVQVNNYSGLAMAGSAPGSRQEFFEKGTEPTTVSRQESVLFDDGDINSPSQPQTPASPSSPGGDTGTDDIF